MRFDLIDLKLFLNISEAGSITMGAKLSRLTLQAASERLRGMEGELGIPLMKRSKSGVSLSEAGFSLQRHAKVVLNHIECMRSELSKFGHGMNGHIKILCNSAAHSEYLPVLVGEFLRANENISIDVREKSSGEIVSDLRNNVSDLGIVADSVDLDGLSMVPFRADNLVVVAPSKSGRLKNNEVYFSEVVSMPFVGLSEGSALQLSLENHAKSLGARMNYRVRLASFDAVAQVISCGVGIGIVPQQAAERLVHQLDIRTIRLKDEWALRKLMICFREFETLPVYYQELVEFLKDGGLHMVSKTVGAG